MRSFVFNLLPTKPKEIEVKEEKRDRLSVRSAFLPLLAALFWLALIIFNGLVVEKVKSSWVNAVADKERKINVQYLPLRIQHGELVTKTNLLSQVIEKDIKPEELFVLTEKLFPKTEVGVEIKGYGRDQDGSFSVNLSTANYTQFAQILRRFTSYSGVKLVKSRGVILDPKLNEVNGTVNFFFNLENLKSQTNLNL